MDYQTIFKRYEIKYLLTKSQQRALLEVMRPYMVPDHYGHTTIRNIYFDTDSYQLIRQSLEKPVYKEKFRVRSYSLANRESVVFVELKKKYDCVVYKRRVAMTENQALEWLCGGTYHPEPSQIVEEIEYFRSFYKTLHPVVFLGYERDAYASRNGDSFRVTFDTHITSRETDLSLETRIYGNQLLPQDRVLMELKTIGGIPLWMTDFLTENRIFRTSFSKYGTAYTQEILEKEFGGLLYA